MIDTSAVVKPLLSLLTECRDALSKGQRQDLVDRINEEIRQHEEGQKQFWARFEYWKSMQGTLVEMEDYRRTHPLKDGDK